MAKHRSSRRRRRRPVRGSRVRSNPPETTLERHRRLMGQAERALVKTDDSTLEYERMRREMRGGDGKSRMRRVGGVAADVTRTGVTKFPLTAVVITAIIAGWIGYQMGAPSAPTG